MTAEQRVERAEVWQRRVAEVRARHRDAIDHFHAAAMVLERLAEDVDRELQLARAAALDEQATHQDPHPVARPVCR